MLVVVNMGSDIWWGRKLVTTPVTGVTVEYNRQTAVGSSCNRGWGYRAGGGGYGRYYG
jgi:hypothetical protein